MKKDKMEVNITQKNELTWQCTQHQPVTWELGWYYKKTKTLYNILGRVSRKRNGNWKVYVVPYDLLDYSDSIPMFCENKPNRQYAMKAVEMHLKRYIDITTGEKLCLKN